MSSNSNECDVSFVKLNVTTSCAGDSNIPYTWEECAYKLADGCTKRDGVIRELEDDVKALKHNKLISAEVYENLMDDCVLRSERIKELGLEIADQDEMIIELEEDVKVLKLALLVSAEINENLTEECVLRSNQIKALEDIFRLVDDNENKT